MFRMLDHRTDYWKDGLRARHAGPRLGPGRQFRQHGGQGRQPNLSVYSASMAAVIALTKSAGKELATSGVLINVITPVYDISGGRATY